MFEVVEIAYSTVREYVHYSDTYPQLVGDKGDLKDAQRPWALETIGQLLPAGGRVLDLGGSRCELAAALAERYDVTVIDPYDGRGGGPDNPDLYRSRHPDITIVQGLLEPGSELPKHDVVVSTSVVEHVDPAQHRRLVEAIHGVLSPGGYSVHAVDLTCRGVNGFLESQQGLCQSWCDAHGITISVPMLVEQMLSDVETFWLPVTMYQQWRRNKTYDQYPWRQVGTMNLVARRRT